MLQFLDPDSRFRALINEVSHQIQHTGLSDWEIAERCGTSAGFVRRQRKFLSVMGSLSETQRTFPFIDKEDEMPNKIPISREDLHREYIENEKTLKECAEIFGCSVGVIGERLKEFDIPARPRGGSRKKETALSVSEGGVGEEVNGKPPVPDMDSLSEVKTQDRLLERLMFLSVLKGASIQELLEEALELLFEKYGAKER